MAETNKLMFDAHGRLMAEVEPDLDLLEQEIAGPTITGVRTSWTEGVASGLTPERLTRLMRDAAQGEHRAYLILAEEMEERDAHYASVLGTRKRGVTRIKAQVEPGDDSALAKDIAEACQRLIERPKIAQGIKDLMDALGKGFSVCEVVWHFGATWEPESLVWRDPRFFQWDPVSKSELRLCDEANLMWGLPLAPYKFVVHRPQIKTGIPIRGGLARLASWAYLFKAYDLKNWAQFLEIFGRPIRVGKYDPQDRPEDIEALRRAVARMGATAAGIIPKSMEIEFVQLANIGGAANIFEKSADWWDSQVSKGVLGQTMTSDDGSSLSQAQVHNEVRHDILQDDADTLEGTLNRDLLRPYVLLNWGEQERWPRVTIPVVEPEDVAALADSVAKLVPVGLRVSQDQIREKLGLRNPRADEEILMAEAPMAPAPSADPLAPGLNRQHAACPHCHRLALNAPGDGTEPDLDEIDVPFLDQWQQVLDPLFEPLRALMRASNSFDEFKAGLAELHGQFDDTDQRLIEAIGAMGFMARGQGNVED